MGGEDVQILPEFQMRHYEDGAIKEDGGDSMKSFYLFLIYHSE